MLPDILPHYSELYMLFTPLRGISERANPGELVRFNQQSDLIAYDCGLCGGSNLPSRADAEVSLIEAPHTSDQERALRPRYVDITTQHRIRRLATLAQPHDIQKPSMTLANHLLKSSIFFSLRFCRVSSRGNQIHHRHLTPVHKPVR